jgi:hypothetical protein
MKVAFLFKNDFLTKFAQEADLFESFKVVVHPNAFVVSLDSWNQEQMDSAINSKGEGFSLVACFGPDVIHWVDPTVKVLSTGKQWFLIEDYIKFGQQKILFENDKDSSWYVGMDVFPLPDFTSEKECGTLPSGEK